MRRLRFGFAVAVFLGSFLLFLVEPIAAKQLLPVLGGSAAVWITCLVFFQAALLAAYLYAHWAAHHKQRLIYLLLIILAIVSACSWASDASSGRDPSGHPVLAVFAALGLSIGLPFLVLGTTSPLMQVWWARNEGGAIPYRLYALSNLASLLALGLYPTVIEPSLTLHAQRLTWTAGFIVFAILAGSLAFFAGSVPVASPPTTPEESLLLPAASLRHKTLWVLLPMGAAMQLSAVTSYLTANVAAIPFLWILPLAAYLLSLIAAFQFPRLLPRSILGRFLIVMLAALGYMLSHVEVTWPMRIAIIFFLIEIFVSCLFLHSEACALRPARPSESTLFYLLFAAGGALGAFLIGIGCPLVFSFNYDLSLTFFITALLALAVMWTGGWSQRMLWSIASAALLALVIFIRIAFQHNTTVAVRNFYGSLRVTQDNSFPGATVRTLSNGAIQHGTQIFASDQLRRTPTTYYAEDSGVGLALRLCCQGRARNIGVIGLGAGTIAAYGHPGDHIRFYEINPAVEPIARNVFTYIRDSGATIEIADGDARTSLAREQPHAFDVLVVDAFSGDAIPLHLLTLQALALYRHHLAPNGIIAFHVSNQHVFLEPAVAQLAYSSHMLSARVASLSNDSRGEYGATWILLTTNAAFLAQPELMASAHPPSLKPGLRLWTDDYSSLLPLLRW